MPIETSGSPSMTRWEEDKTSLPQVRVYPLPSLDDDASTIGDNFSDTSSISSLPDRNAHGWKILRVRDPRTKKVYEAWEIISVRPTSELRTASRILGINIHSTHGVLKDGYTGVRAVPSYSQDELENMVSAAEKRYNTPSFDLRRIAGRASYAQDLAKRLFGLPGCLPNKLGALLDSRFVATNKSQFARREWKIVLLQPFEDVMTDGTPKTKIPGLFAEFNNRKEEPVQKWLVVLQGHVTRTSEEGFEAFDTFANPWLKVDEKLERDNAGYPRQSTGRWTRR